VGIPIFDGITSLFSTWTEYIKGRYSVKIAEYNKQIRALGTDADANKQVIGFVMEEEEPEDEDEIL
jgi:hypothetical protein